MTSKRPASSPQQQTATNKMVNNSETHGFKPSASATVRPAAKPPAPPAGSGGGSK